MPFVVYCLCRTKFSLALCNLYILMMKDSLLREVNNMPYEVFFTDSDKQRAVGNAEVRKRIT